MQVVDCVDLCLKHLLGAAEAGAHSGIERSTRDGDAESCGSKQGILFGMHTDTEIVAGAGRILLAMRASMTATVETVRHILRSAVVSCGDDMPVENDDRSHPVSVTVGPRPDGDGNAQKIFFRCWTP